MLYVTHSHLITYHKLCDRLFLSPHPHHYLRFCCPIVHLSFYLFALFPIALIASRSLPRPSLTCHLSFPFPHFPLIYILYLPLLRHSFHPPFHPFSLISLLVCLFLPYLRPHFPLPFLPPTSYSEIPIQHEQQCPSQPGLPGRQPVLAQVHPPL